MENDIIMEELDTMRYYLSKEEFEHSMSSNFGNYLAKFSACLTLEQLHHVQNPSISTTAGVADVYVYQDPIMTKFDRKYEEKLSRQKLASLCSIEEYFSRRKLIRQAGIVGRIGKEIHLQFSRKEGVVQNLEGEKPNRRLKVILSGKYCSDVPKLTQRNPKRKREEIKKKSNRKNPPIVYDIPVVNQLPAEFLERIRELNGKDIEKCVEKRLTASDVNSNLNRLLITDKCKKADFLKESEIERVDKQETVEATLIESSNSYDEVKINKWHMERNKYLALITPWKYMVQSNGFAKGDVIQIWSFRYDDNKTADKLGLAIVRTFRAPRESDGTESSGVCSS